MIRASFHLFFAGALKIGDYIILRNPKFESHLSSEGILVEDVYMDGDVKNISDFIFCVHQQRQYSASKELESFERSVPDVLNAPDHVKKYITALQRGRDNENELNENYLKNQIGKVVVFGDTIQVPLVIS